MKNLNKIAVAMVYVAIFILIVVAGAKTVTAAENLTYVTELKDNTPVDKISVSGNVEVFVKLGDQQSITVYDNYYGKNALTQIEDGTLRISSYEDKKLAVWVTITNLKSIEAFDQAQVFGINEFNLLDLNITLGNEAIANINVDAYQVNTNISGTSKLILIGDAEYQSITATDQSNIDISKFASAKQELNLCKQASITIGNKQNTLSQVLKFEDPNTELNLCLSSLQ
jgi:hypothetical protein